MTHNAHTLTPEQLKDVCRRSNWTGLAWVAHAWGLIFAAMALFAVWPNPLTFILGVLVVGGRQLGLAVLMHDGAHGVLCRSPKLNAFVSQWFCAYPVFAETWRYRSYHLKHHRHVQQKDDPDLGLSAPFPITWASFRRKMIRDLTGQTAFKQRRSQLRAALGPSDWPLWKRANRFRKELGPALFCNGVLLAGLTLAGHWYLYFVLWLLPLVTWQQAITRIRNIAEHAMVPDNDDPLRNARTTLAGPIVRTIIAPYNVHYHVEHHMLMYVPCYNLPKMHGYLGDNGTLASMEVQPGYWSVLKLAMSKPGGQEPSPAS